MPDDPAFYVSLLVTFLSGGFIGAYLNHIFAKNRDTRSREYASAIAREQRKRDFLAAMQQWRVEIDRLHLGIGGYMRKPSVFLDGVSSFMAQVQMIRLDFSGDRGSKFDELVAKVPKCKAHQTGDILKSIDDLCAYVESAAE